MSDRLPTWLEEVGDFTTANAQVVFSGNIRDIYLVPGPPGEPPRLLPLIEALWRQLNGLGYDFMLVWDRVDRLQPWPANALPAALQFLDLPASQTALPPLALEELPPLLQRAVRSNGPRVAVLIDYASRLGGAAPQMPDDLLGFFTACEKLSHTVRRIGSANGRRMFNPIFWLVNQVGDLPEWLVIGNDRVRSKVIPKPDPADRRQMATMIAETFTSIERMTASETRAHDGFVHQTEGLTLGAMGAIAELAQRREMPLERIEDAVQLFKIGIAEDPWKSDELRPKVKQAEEALKRRVKGQEQAIEKVADILRRAVIGLNGAHVGDSGSGRPKGVLFFAGPTGVGKTELAKAISELIFGNERAYLRFDMSEFSAEHSASRLIGAPPGYVGYDAGGELTNGMREKPFSVVLFDEIEKAHPRLLDKFLQILEDGRLTDGRGDTVYFSQAVIVFTSNLGIYRDDPTQPGKLIAVVTPEEPYPQMAAKIRAEITDHFKRKLGRPEILNRFGDNIVVFGFISPDIARQIFQIAIDRTVARVKAELDVDLELTSAAFDKLAQECTRNLDNGGRGIMNQVEARLVNPLSRALFDKLASSDRRRFTLADARETEGRYVVELQ